MSGITVALIVAAIGQVVSAVVVWRIHRRVQWLELKSNAIERALIAEIIWRGER